MEYGLKMKKILVILMAMVMCAATILPSETTAAAATEGAVQKVTLKIGNKNVTKKTKSMYIGSTATLKVKVTPTAAKKKITYKSSRKSVAVVNSKGRITAKRAGTTKITVTVTGKDNVRKTTYVKIRVKKRPVSKITLNKTSVNMYTGSSYTLKATVYPKKATNKKVYWISSNKNVAVVSSTGKVTAKNPGTAVITVKAKDGSKKQRTCKVTVRKKPVDITGLEIISQTKLKLTLSEPVKLTDDKFTVKKKMTKNGAYYLECPIKLVVSADNKTYILLLKEEGVIEAGSYAGVFVTGLTGKSMIEKQVCYDPIPEEIVITEEVGTSLNLDFCLNSDSTVGYAKYEIVSGTLVKGISIEELSGKHYIKGTPEEAADNQKAVIRETDEMGNQRDITVVQNFYDANNIVCESDTYVQNLGDNYYAAMIYIKGGSGSYTCSLVETDADFITEIDVLSTSIYIATDKSKIVKPGTYKARFKVTDAANPEIYTYATYTWIFEERLITTVTINNMTEAEYEDYYYLGFVDVTTGSQTRASDKSYIKDTLQSEYTVKSKPGMYHVYMYNGETWMLICRNVKITASGKLTYDWPAVSGQSAK